MISLSGQDVISNLLRRWANPSEFLPEPVGSTGYQLPPLIDLSISEIGLPSTGNWLLSDSGRDIDRLSFDIGEGCVNNTIILAKGSACCGRVFIRGSDNLAIIIGARNGIHPINVHFHSSYHTFFFGEYSTSNTATFEMGTDGTSIIVGEDCMFSAFIDLSTDDHHTLIDFKSGTHLNPAASIHIQPHVWVGISSMILKGVTVGFGSVIGARSLVTRDVPSRSVVAGSPARVIRSDISWGRERLPTDRTIHHLRDLDRRLNSGRTA